MENMDKGAAEMAAKAKPMAAAAKTIELEARFEGGNGCIQGSIAGPTFWNCTLDYLLREFGVYVQAFTDDVVPMFSKRLASSVKEEVKQALFHEHCWETKKQVESTQGDVVPESRVVRAIHIYAIKPIMYFSCAWTSAMIKLDVHKILNAVQRNVALKVKCDKYLPDTFLDRELKIAVYFDKLPCLACVPEIGFESVKALQTSSKRLEDTKNANGTKVRKPFRVTMTGLDRRRPIATEKQPELDKVVAALTEWRDGKETWYSTFRFDVFCTVFQEEMLALQRVIQRVEKGKDELSDCKRKCVARHAACRRYSTTGGGVRDKLEFCPELGVCSALVLKNLSRLLPTNDA
ncbi:hypothetical protein EVAR_24816_1 [Eumeta japonica]|uniref:Reverse transcriptase domain-containing protein n=1 Tax=Eumeta variegata TaxID=151549 RepID=A0A4C1W1F6_EUMVA|nr:hypothetical protein EVAR_24816_1 [Eumeta japonica]